MKKEEMDQFPSRVTSEPQNHPEYDGERRGDNRREREGMSKCMWEGRDEDHFTETQQ